jgi:integrase
MSAGAPTLPDVLRIDQDAVEELVDVKDADELCRLLLGNPGGWGRSTRHAEAVELLTRVHGTGELPFSLAGRPLLLRPRKQPRLFVNQHGNGLTRQGIYQIVQGHARTAGLTERITPRTIRHACATHLLASGVEPQTCTPSCPPPPDRQPFPIAVSATGHSSSAHRRE